MAISNKKNRALSRVLRNVLRENTAVRENPAKQEPGTPANGANAPAYSLPTDIPKNYDDTYVRAIPKDPQSTFVYWEMPKEVTRECVFPDKGTAHVNNHEVARVHEHFQQQWHDNHNHNNNAWQNDNHRWLDENSRWLNNTQFWPGDNHNRQCGDNGNNSRDHGCCGGGQHTRDGNDQYCGNDNNPRHDGSNRRHTLHGAKSYTSAGVFSLMLDNLMNQCQRYIEDGKSHQYMPSPTSSEFYKVKPGAEASRE